MTRIHTVFSAAAITLAVSLSGCATGQSPDAAERTIRAFGEAYAHCERHFTYTAGVGIMAPGVQISGSIDCKPRPVAVWGDPAPVDPPL